MLTFAKFDFLINSLVVLWRNSSVVSRSDTNNKLLIEKFLYNSDFDMAIALGDRVVEALEPNKLVLLFHIPSHFFVMIKLSLSSLDTHKLLAIGCISFSIGKALEKLIWLQCSK